MKLRHKILGAAALVIVAGLSTLALVLSHDAPCGAVSEGDPTAASMKAVVRRCYGAPEVLRLAYVTRPSLADDAVLVKVRAAALNPLDWHMMRGDPYIMRAGLGIGTPKDIRLGIDFAGTVEAVGRNVTQFKQGDAVFGATDGAFAEYVSVAANGAVTLKPDSLTFEQAAAVPVAGLTALQALRDHGKVQPGQRVLINGAAGGVGLLAVQIGKELGAEVTGVSSSKNAALVNSMGASRVIDYTREDYADGSRRYDVILDLVGNRSLSDNRRALLPTGIYIGIGGGTPSEGGLLGPVVGALKQLLLAPFVSQKLVLFEAQLSQKDLASLSELIGAGKLTPVIDRQFTFAHVAQAISYLEQGHAHGKVVITPN
jgi:NADPH:quinone reductase-like Zn-dependent oxidoreductase